MESWITAVIALCLLSLQIQLLMQLSAIRLLKRWLLACRQHNERRQLESHYHFSAIRDADRQRN